ncbi:Hypothetical predicted protein [Octopus vulgaris]|uniref:Uncharacterized protein n=1 Tax=Octopus vulgaris TaxID=6645 RepID=A0AA36FEA6_OCTVU|nr:Hypothetical predicted protein [Octopus vulgaris]
MRGGDERIDGCKNIADGGIPGGGSNIHERGDSATGNNSVGGSGNGCGASSGAVLRGGGFCWWTWCLCCLSRDEVPKDPTNFFEKPYAHV